MNHWINLSILKVGKLIDQFDGILRQLKGLNPIYTG